jgi:hypothetical protein
MLKLEVYQVPLKRVVDRQENMWDLCSSVMLRSVCWHMVTDVSEQPIRCIFKGQEVQGGTDRLSRNVDNYQYALRNIQEERISHLHRGGSLKSRKIIAANVLSCAENTVLWKNGRSKARRTTLSCSVVNLAGPSDQEPPVCAMRSIETARDAFLLSISNECFC